MNNNNPNNDAATTVEGRALPEGWAPPSRDEILECLRVAQAPLTPAELATRLDVPADGFEILGRRLRAMERDGQLLPNRKGVLLLASKLDLIAGRVQGHRDGFGFLVPDKGGGDVFIPPREMQKAMHGDRVLVKLTGYDSRGRAEGTIVEVTGRTNRRLVGRLLNERGVTIVVPEDQRIKHDILIPPGDAGRAQPGQVVTVEITDPPSGHAAPIGKVVEVLGEIDDPGMEIEIAVRKFDVPHEFPRAALEMAEALPGTVRPADLKGRVDLRDVPLVTIDGEDARDFDDAVYCEPILDAGEGKGGARGPRKAPEYRLIVAIADVGHYVGSGNALDLEAIRRSTSVYFPRRVIPMLPEKLSNGLCSLNPAVDRLVLVCDMVITAKGQIKAYQFYEAVMHSAARLTYDEVWGVLSGRDVQAIKRRAALVPQLQHLYSLFQLLSKARELRGAIEFDSVETKIVCDAAGRIERIVPRPRNDAHKLIEECMLAANVCAADFMTRSKHPGLYRVHEGPTTERLQKLRDFLRTVGLSLGGGDQPAPADYAELALKAKARPDAALMQTMILRSMQQAIYTPDNSGHFGLAYEAYAHFTSPIRRYPDLLTHRVIKALLRGQRYVPRWPDDEASDTASAATPARGLPAPPVAGAPSEALAATADAPRSKGSRRGGKGRAAAASSGAASASAAVPAQAAPLAVSATARGGRSDPHETWVRYGIVCSANERRADEASRDVEAWLKCQYMRERVGEQFAGRITGVATFGIFVTLNDLYVDGLVHVSELGGEYFQYNETTHELRGERTGRRFRLTDEFHVQVSRVDLEARRIEFRPVQPFGLKAELRGMGIVPEPVATVRKAAPAKNEDVKRARAARAAAGARRGGIAHGRSAKSTKSSKSSKRR